ncbi:MAG: glycosyltransferase family 39 protein [bacterium]
MLDMFIFIILTILPGYLLFMIFFNESRKKLIERLAIAYGLGFFVITIQLFVILFIFRMSFSDWFYAVFAAEDILLFIYIFKKNISLDIRLNFRFLKEIHAKEAIVIFFIFLQLFFSSSNALSRSIINYDSLNIWSLRAKILYFENRAGFDSNDKFKYLGGSWHTNYPWHVPLAQYWFQANRGEYDDYGVNMIFVLYFVALLALVFSFCRRYTSVFSSLVFTFLLSTMPLILYHSWNAYADMVLSYYLLISFFYLFEWFRDRNKKDLIISGLFGGISFFVKIDAIVFMIAGILSVSLFLLTSEFAKNKIKTFVYYFFSFIVPIFPWIVFLFFYNLGIRNISDGIGWHVEIYKNLLTNFFVNNSWNIWWYIAVFLFIINIKKIIKNKVLLFGWAFFFLSFSGFLILYLFTDEYQFVLNNTAVARNIILFTPLSVFLIAVTDSK